MQATAVLLYRISLSWPVSHQDRDSRFRGLVVVVPGMDGNCRIKLELETRTVAANVGDAIGSPRAGL